MTEPRHILIAEDNDNDFWFFELGFKSAFNIKVTRARDGEEAIKYLAGEGPFTNRQAHPLPCLVVLDLAMPRKNGFEVLEWLQSRPEFHALPRLVLSVSAGKADVKRAFELGATSFLAKPEKYDRYLALVNVIKDYWLEWNVIPTSLHANTKWSGPAPESNQSK